MKSLVLSYLLPRRASGIAATIVAGILAFNEIADRQETAEVLNQLGLVYYNIKNSLSNWNFNQL